MAAWATAAVPAIAAADRGDDAALPTVRGGGEQLLQAALLARNESPRPRGDDAAMPRLSMPLAMLSALRALAGRCKEGVPEVGSALMPAHLPHCRGTSEPC